MAPRMKGKRILIVLSSVAVIAAGAVAITVRSGDGPGSSTSPEEPTTAVSETARNETDEDRVPLLSVSDESVRFQVPQGSYISRPDRVLAEYHEPEPLDAGPLTLRRSEGNVGGHIAIFVTDQDKKIEDVMVIGNFVTKHQVGKLQWLMTKDGVELAWDTDGFSDWTVERSGTSLTTKGDGHYFDPVPVAEPTRYRTSHVEKVEVEVDGKTVMADKPTGYTALMPKYDNSLIGRHIDTIGPLQVPGIVPQRPASTASGAAAREHFAPRKARVAL